MRPDDMVRAGEIIVALSASEEEGQKRTLGALKALFGERERSPETWYDYPDKLLQEVVMTGSYHKPDRLIFQGLMTDKYDWYVLWKKEDGITVVSTSQKTPELALRAELARLKTFYTE